MKTSGFRCETKFGLLVFWDTLLHSVKLIFVTIISKDDWLDDHIKEKGPTDFPRTIIFKTIEHIRSWHNHRHKNTYIELEKWCTGQGS